MTINPNKPPSDPNPDCLWRPNRFNGVDYNDSIMQTIPESNRELTSKAQNHILYEVGCNIIIYVWL